MRKREIHSVAHWAMMFLLLMFPLLMVGISVLEKPNDNDYTELQYIDYSDSLPAYDVYFSYNVNLDTAQFGNERPEFYITNTQYLSGNLSTTQQESLLASPFIRIWYYGDAPYLTWENAPSPTNYNARNFNFVLSCDLVNVQANPNDVQIDLFYRLIDINDNTYKGDVNKWVNQFIDLPINAWYKSLMNVIGVGFTNSSVMNVIYVMPVYILWVFIFDVIVDCFLVIIKLPHKLLNRLSGGENE